ncbi:hypothetical protein [Synechococcus sp. BA-132 BA5]|uniref:hypothetical protein n=1 Tax=Synechococcus sp. BA-132 BA5 TaxID=3110252 RepID=UPI002B1FBCAB|nr:hypothetical protein [Synechococcus sp. BA-132 BA5]MEA5414824.1 hypothetical protein [Synechococcus sp. BA-132 BA5]
MLELKSGSTRNFDQRVLPCRSITERPPLHGARLGRRADAQQPIHVGRDVATSPLKVPSGNIQNGGSGVTRLRQLDRPQAGGTPGELSCANGSRKKLEGVDGTRQFYVSIDLGRTLQHTQSSGIEINRTFLPANRARRLGRLGELAVPERDIQFPISGAVPERNGIRTGNIDENPGVCPQFQAGIRT